MPDLADGELWIDRRKFQRTVSIVRRQDKSDPWKEVRFLVFDAPLAAEARRESVTLSRPGDAVFPAWSGDCSPSS